MADNDPKVPDTCKVALLYPRLGMRIEVMWLPDMNKALQEELRESENPEQVIKNFIRLLGFQVTFGVVAEPREQKPVIAGPGSVDPNLLRRIMDQRP